MIPPHEIPTHLDVPDRAFLGLTVRQFVAIAVGLGCGFLALDVLGAPPGLLGFAVCAIAGACVAFIQPLGQPLEDWIFILVRYASSPRRATWRRAGRGDRGVRLREVAIERDPIDRDPIERDTEAAS